MDQSVCLNSQELRQKIRDGAIITNRAIGDLENQIQPASYEPTLKGELHILDVEKGLFRPKKNETIRRTILQLPGRQRRKVDISDGFELKRGFTYLVPLEERLKLNPEEFVRASQKSSNGRVFLNTRLLADYNIGFDEINSQYGGDKELNLWLLIQPLAFNVIAYQGLSVAQLRLFSNHGAQLSSAEILQEFNKNPLLYIQEEDKLKPAKPIIRDGLQIHLDLSGESTKGIVGLRARRNNPTPIDLKKSKEYDAEEFFEPLTTNDGALTIKKGEYYLLVSKEVLDIPPHLNVELNSHSNIGFGGPLHFAGFIDNGFKGRLVLEARCDEVSDMVLEDGMPISKLDIFRTNVPDKLYGAAIGSNYQEQAGPRLAKFFKNFDFDSATRNYKKLTRSVLVQDSKLLRSHRHAPFGFEFMQERDTKDLFDIIEKKSFFHFRYDCESDSDILQVIPYVLVFAPNETIFSYVRANNIIDYGDERLFDKHSIGLGGHIAQTDGPDYIKNCLNREVIKEEAEITGKMTEPKFVGTLYQPDKPVDEVHFGLVYVIFTDGEVKPKESSINRGRMLPIKEILTDPDYTKKYETWSKALIPFLCAISKFAQ